MKSYLFAIFIGVILLSCAGSSTSTQSSWKNPNSSVSVGELSKVLVVAMANDQAQRRSIEDAFVAELGGKGMPSYAYFKTPLNQVNPQTASSQLSTDGYDGAIVLRLADHNVTGSQRNGSVSLQPSLYYGFGRNLSAGVGLSINPGYNTRKDEYTVETSVYEFPKDDLIWSGMTLATNPDNVTTMAHEMANQVFSKMRSDGFLH